MNKDLSIAIILMLILSVVLIATVKLMFFGFVGLFASGAAMLVCIADRE